MNPQFKIIILTQYYPPEHGAPQNRLHDLAKRMRKAGHEITVLSAMPNYPRGEVFPDYRGRFCLSEEIDGVKVIRSWILPSKKKNVLLQLICYFSFAVSSAFVGLFKLKKADALICESPPLFLGATALFLSFAKFAKLIMNVSDLWPESAVQLGMLKPGFALSALEGFEKLLYKKSAVVICQTDGIVAGVKKRHSGAKTFLLPNGVDLEAFGKQPRDANFAKDRDIQEGSFIVGYAGNHGRSQALSQILDAAKIIRDGGGTNERSGKIIFVMVGDGHEKTGLQAKAKEMGLENLIFCDSVPREKMAWLLSQFDLAVVPLKDIKIFDGARPSKIFELMACEIPFIFCGRGEGAEIAEKSGGAFVVPPENPEALASAIIAFANFAAQRRIKMGLTARKFAEDNYDRAKIAEDFFSEINGIGASIN